MNLCANTRHIAFAAVLGYASAGLIAPLVYGANAGDVQAAAIDATVAAQDTVRAIGEGQARAVEASRDLHENAYWGSVAASQNYVAAAQSQAAALNGAAAAVRAAHLAAPAVAPLGYAGYGLRSAYGLAPYGLAPYGLGLHAW
ncbi:unnamed protein product, partial [Iphiclides podalirius]